MDENEPLLTPDETGAYIKKPPKTLAEWRSRRIGPKYLKLGNVVRYRRRDVDVWLDAQTVDPELGRMRHRDTPKAPDRGASPDQSRRKAARSRLIEHAAGARGGPPRERS